MQLDGVRSDQSLRRRFGRRILTDAGYLVHATTLLLRRGAHGRFAVARRRIDLTDPAVHGSQRFQGPGVFVARFTRVEDDKMRLVRE
jgi:hypothetical protein